MQSLAGPGSDYLEIRSKREAEMQSLKQQLMKSRMETERMEAALRTQQMILERNTQELMSYRTSVERRESELQRLRIEEKARLQSVMNDYRMRFEKERATLKVALMQCEMTCKTIEEVLPDCQECEKVLLGETPNFRPTRIMAAPAQASVLRRSFPAEGLRMSQEFVGLRTSADSLPSLRGTAEGLPSSPYAGLVTTISTGGTATKRILMA